MNWPYLRPSWKPPRRTVPEVYRCLSSSSERPSGALRSAKVGTKKTTNVALSIRIRKVKDRAHKNIKEADADGAAETLVRAGVGSRSQSYTTVCGGG